MKLQLSKFGNILTSRQDGREAFAAVNSQLLNLDRDEKIEIDFDGVSTLTPSWADEFITKIEDRYGKKVVILHTDNPSVKATLKILQQVKE